MPSVKTDADWEAENDADNLKRSAEIIADPKRKKRAMAKLDAQQKLLAKVGKKLKEVLG